MADRHTAQDDIIIRRRERVATLRNRGMTQREIWATLATPHLPDRSPNPSFTLNPETHQPYDLATVSRDLKWLLVCRFVCAMLKLGMKMRLFVHNLEDAMTGSQKRALLILLILVLVLIALVLQNPSLLLSTEGAITP